MVKKQQPALSDMIATLGRDMQSYTKAWPMRMQVVIAQRMIDFRLIDGSHVNYKFDSQEELGYVSKYLDRVLGLLLREGA